MCVGMLEACLVCDLCANRGRTDLPVPDRRRAEIGLPRRDEMLTTAFQVWISWRRTAPLYRLRVLTPFRRGVKT